jgi:tripartite-type tricarboxylate transporter receptor subunit TctC
MDKLKNLPSFKELKLPAVESGTWQGIVTTAGTPAPVVARLNAELKKVLSIPDIRSKIVDLGGEVIANPPEEFASWMKENIASWGAVVREANIKVE